MSKTLFFALATAPGIGGATMMQLLSQFGDMESIWEASDEELLRVPRVTAKAIQHFRAVSLDQLEIELDSLADEGIDVLTWDEEAYPDNLRDISSPPPILFVQGELLDEDSDAVAIIGSREASTDTQAIAQTIAYELADRGLTIISGLAVGIDTAAHRGALEAEGRTIAVLGSGLRQVHPRSNIRLAREISQTGALVSELMPSTPVQGKNLMARDRLTSGLSRAVIVIEAGHPSGSLDTAKKALDQHRLLLALPNSPGTDILVSEGTESLDPRHANWDDLAQRIRDYRPAPPVKPEVSPQPSLF